MIPTLPPLSSIAKSFVILLKVLARVVLESLRYKVAFASVDSKVARTLSPDTTCNGLLGLFVPIPTLPLSLLIVIAGISSVRVVPLVLCLPIIIKLLLPSY